MTPVPLISTTNMFMVCVMSGLAHGVHEEVVAGLLVEQVEDGEVHGRPSGGGDGADGGILSPALRVGPCNMMSMPWPSPSDTL